jgi:hypothetical protein
VPTKPLESILYRELSRLNAKEFIDTASPLLQELINYATNVLARCADSSSGKVDEDVAILALYRHIIEMTDGIESLISQSCAIPAIPLLRSSFEASLSMGYILENNTEYTRRSLAWLIGYVHKRLDMYERFDPSTSKGQEFKRLFDKDETVSGVNMPPSSEAQKAIINLQSMLSKPHLQEVEKEYSSFKKAPNWYRLFGGPPNLRALAEHLNRGAQYEFLYRQWSTTAHAQDLLPFIARTEKGASAIGGLRNPKELKSVTSFTATFILNATRLILGKLRPGEDFSKWYIREVRDRYLFITAAKQ